MRRRRNGYTRNRQLNWRSMAKRAFLLVLAITTSIGFLMLMAPPDKYHSLPDCPDAREILSEDVTIIGFIDCFVSENMGRIKQNGEATLNRISAVV